MTMMVAEDEWLEPAPKQEKEEDLDHSSDDHSSDERFLSWAVSHRYSRL